MLLSYVVSCIYILILGGYWIYTFARTRKDCQHQIFPGIVISLVCFCVLLLLIFVSIVYFCYLRYKVKLNIKEIVSKTMSQNNKVFIGLICTDILLGFVIYYFTVKESIENQRDFIKIHCLFIIMIMFVGSLNGLRWFNLKKAWEVILFCIFLFGTGAMYFLDFYKPNNNNKNPQDLEYSPPPIFEHYISGPIIITYQYMYLSLGNKFPVQRIICKIIQYGSMFIFAQRYYDLIIDERNGTFFQFDFIWAAVVALTAIIIIIKDIYRLGKYIFMKVSQKNRQKYIQQIRERINTYLQARSILNQTEVQLNFKDQCTICLQTLQNESKHVKLDCNHSFHFTCVFQWFNKETTCPICRNSYQIRI